MIKPCSYCQNSFVSPYSASRFCSTECHFWSHVTKGDQCWSWNGVKSNSGYGKMSRRGVAVFAHRFSWELHNARPVPYGLFVLHHCDNPICVRPDHLFVGSLKDNIHDAMRKGRHVAPPVHRGTDNILVRRPELRPRGERHHSHKLTESQVVEILASDASGVSLATKYGVQKTLISAIRNRKIWKHVKI